MKKILVAVFAMLAGVFGAPMANADSCGAGYYYNDNNECVVCQNNHYCTGDGTMQPCPEFTYNDITDVYPMIVGYNVHSIWRASLDSNASYASSTMTNINRCVLVFTNIEVDEGMIYKYKYNYSSDSGAYDQFKLILWNRANAGYYLTTVYSSGAWRGVKSCTNAPANAHYTGPGTPDSSTVTDANDCPWVCDDGYYGSSAAGSSSCTLCEAGNFCTGGVKTACSAGYYSSTTGATSCTACTTDPTTGRPTYSTTAGATSCTVCPAATVYADRVTEYNYWSTDGVHNVAWGCRAVITEQDQTGNYTLSCANASGDYGVSCKSSDCCMGSDITSCAAGYYAPAGSVWKPTVTAMEGQVCVPVGSGYYSADGALTRTACSGATYSDTTTAAICTACPAGYDYNTDAGKTAATQCQTNCTTSEWIPTVPSTYTVLEYLENGGQWIMTNIPWTSVARFRGKAQQSEEQVLNRAVFGSSEYGSNYLHMFWGTSYLSSQDGKTQWYWNTDILPTTAAEFDIVRDSSTAWHGTVNNVSTSISSAAFAGNVVLMSTNDRNIDYANRYFNGTVWYLQLFDTNGNALFDGVPARRNSDDVVGIYDTVTGTFFTSSATEGAFVAGPAGGAQCTDVGVGYSSVGGAVNFGSSLSRTPNTITIEWAGANGTYQTGSCTYGGGFSTPVNPPTRRGYRFDGWTFVTE